MTAITVAEAIAELGIVQESDEDIILAVIDDAGVRHYRLPEIAQRDVASFESLYLASGSFLEGMVKRSRGRTGENVVRLYWLPFDCDLSSYLGFSTDREQRAAEIAELHQYDDPMLARLIESQRTDVEAAFAEIGLPIHRLDYTGYGLCAYVYLAPDAATNVGATRELHKAIISRLNAIYPNVELVDRQASDAGTRITRLPPSINRKDGQARTVQTLFFRPGAVDTMELRRAAQAKPERATVTPLRAIDLPESEVEAIIETLAPSWLLGQKHAMGLAVAGIFAKAGLPEAQALSIIQRLSAEDRKPWDREAAVRRSYDRERSGHSVKGFSSLAELIPPEALAFVDRMLDQIRQATSGRILLSPGRAKRKSSAEDDEDRRDAGLEKGFTAPPADVYFGIFGDYARLMEPTSEAPAQFHLGAALSIAGASVGRRVHMNWFSEPLFANTYIVLVGRTGRSRKDTAIKRSLAVRQRPHGRRLVDANFTLRRDVASGPAIVKVLSEYENTLLYLTEFTIMLKNARIENSTLTERLIEAWDTPDTIENTTKKDGLIARNPYLSIIAATQPSRLAENMREEDIQSGFANRWLYIVGRGKEPMARAPNVDWADAYRIWLDIQDAVRSYPEGTEIALSEESNQLWDEWYLKTLVAEGRDEIEDDMRSRHSTLAMKIALTFAISEKAFKVEPRHLRPAIALVEWMWSELRMLIRLWGVGIDTQISERILAKLRDRGPMKRRDLQRITSSRRYGPREFAGVFRAMLENGTIESDPTGVVFLPEETNV